MYSVAVVHQEKAPANNAFTEARTFTYKKPTRAFFLRMSRPVSRVLSRMVIYLGHQLPGASCDLPGKSAGNLILPLLGLAPGGVYLAGQSPGRW